MTLLSVTEEERDTVAAPCFIGSWNGIWAEKESLQMNAEIWGFNKENTSPGLYKPKRHNHISPFDIPWATPELWNHLRGQ